MDGSTAVVGDGSEQGAVDGDPPEPRRWRDRLRRPQRDDLVGCLALVLLVLPFAVGALWAVQQRWFPGQDRGLIELQVLDVGGADTPLLGVYSRYGWRHPGPWGFWLLALPYRALGTGHGLLVAALCVNLTWFLGVMAVCRRQLPPYLQLGAAAALLVLVHGYDGVGLADPWNPWLALAPGVLAVVAAAFASPRNLLAPVAVGAAAVAVQQHVSYLPLAALATGLALWPLVRGRMPRRTVVLTLAVLLVAWAPVALEAVTTDGFGNVGLLAREAGGVPEGRLEIDGTRTERVGPSQGLRLFAREFGPHGTLLTHVPEVDEVGAVDPGPWWPLVVPLGFLALGFEARRASREARRLWRCAVAFLAVTAGGYVVLQGTAYPYILTFGAGPIFLMVVSALWLIGERVRGEAEAGAGAHAGAGAGAVGRPGTLRAATLVCGVATVALSIATCADLVGAAPPEARVGAAAAATAPRVLDHLRLSDVARVSILPKEDPVATGLRVAAARAGYEVGTKRTGCVLLVVPNPQGRAAPRVAGEIARWNAPAHDPPPGGGDLARFFNKRESVVVVARGRTC